MLIDKNARYFLKRTQAAAKEIEFNVPKELRAKMDADIDELFPLTIACISDFAVGIISKKICTKDMENYRQQLYFASKFYDSYLYINNTINAEESNYFFLVGAASYYLCDQIGNSVVLAKKVNYQSLNLSSNQLDLFIYCMLSNTGILDIVINETNIYSSFLKQFKKEYSKVQKSAYTIDFSWINNFRKVVYEQQNDRDIFLIDILLAIFILKVNYSIFNLLPQHSSINLDRLTDIVQGNHFVRELWPSQRYMCELGLFNGKSGVIQMPTGAGKTKSVSIAIYSAFCSDDANLSIVVAPFRALCREISEDLRQDLAFDSNIHISEISDLLQIDYVLEDIFNPERKTVVVTTPEKLLYIFRQDDTIVNNISQIIFDEGHLFDDEERGATYELLITSILKKIDPKAQRILISAIIPNVDEINTWFAGKDGIAFKGNAIAGVDKLPSILGWRNIDRNNYCYLYYINRENSEEDEFYVPRMIEIKRLNNFPRETTPRYFPAVDFVNGKMTEPNDTAIACLLRLVKNDNTAIFCGRKDSANKMLKRIIDLDTRGYDISSIKTRANENEVKKIATLIKENYGEENDIYKAATLGVFTHHRGISEGIKCSIENALRKSLITNVICTSTLAQGVNLPIKYLVISSIYQSNEQIKVRDFHNLIGRTARSGMYTEGTIIFSDPFVYRNRNNRWKWNQYKNLLNPSNSENCSSVLLDIVRPKTIDKLTCNFFNMSILYYENRNLHKEYERKLFNDCGDEIKHWYIHITKTLGKLENYIASLIAENNNTYSDEFIAEMLNGTLAETLATPKEKEDLKKLFKHICDYIEAILPEEQNKRNFSKSLIKIEDYISLKNEIEQVEIDELEGNDLLSFLIKMILKYGTTNHLKKMYSLENVVEFAELWMQGFSYDDINQLKDIYDFKIKKRGNYVPITIDDTVAICNSDLGYSSSIIINSICEILIQKDQDDVYSNTIKRIQKIGMQLKYGLKNQDEIIIYELGFNDRHIAQKIAEIIKHPKSKKIIIKAIKYHRDEIEVFLSDYPSVFEEKLANI